MAYIDKAPASRIIRGQVLGPWAGSGTLQSTNFGLGPGGASIFQVRVISPINGWITIDSVSGASLGSVLSTSTFVPGVFIAANTANGDYFACHPGEVLTFTSTTTSTGGFISLAELS